MEEDGGSFESLSTIQPNIRRLDPFWATRLWQRLIKEALMKVKVCRQRHFLKNYDEVFNGEDLVDNVYQFLKQCTSELDVERIHRSNASKVCQVLMDKKFFESVVPKGNQKFEDSSTKFYRFVQDQITGEDAPKEYEEIKGSILAEEEKENICMSPCNLDSSVFTPDAKFCSKRRSVRLKTPLLRVRDTKPSPVRFSKRSARDPDEEATFALRETALALLLQLVEVPMLESLLSVPFDLPELAEAPQPFIFENDFTPRKIKPINLDYRGPIADLSWVKAASHCLDGRHPVGITGLWSLQACKVLCYKSVVERFSCSAESLIPGEYFSICIPIVQMLKNGQRKQALYALQLLVFHLPWKRRKQLQHLLHFLHLVVNDIFVSVDKKVTNYEAVLRDFLTIVFKHPLVSNDPQKILFDFLLLKSEALFNIPPSLQKVKETGLQFCERISVDDLETTSAKYTDKCLLDLATSVADSTDIKLAEKKLWLKKLKKHHPSAYQACSFEE
ncbi:UNVERIFIED_CONTAM: Depdc7 [Trichonephila clavipes]